ncbi:Flagellar hook-associated protein 3 [Caulifigura coniformis]|uniref:Flagellar hook-associated protein 3 n=1 Tax=Caulifigura coniformis TaxID=2527983 RepID=A0A517SJG2_9PLAN|nr:flagellar hook-associated protein FlgL [Caulifigura coniformis]QDT56236.1 Flagellar hook-associated protein 3 [Caulifigura coniformis]
MAIRVTPQITVAELLKQSTIHSANIAKLQQQIASGQRISRPSDDPLGTKTILSRTALVGQFETQQRSLNQAADRLNQANTELLSASDLLVRARDIASQARSALDESELRNYASEIDTILTQVRSTGNAQFDGQYLFSGDTANSAPYDESGTDFSYNGSLSSLRVSFFGKGSLEVVYSGQKVFGSSNRQPTDISGTTGARPGAGTDTSTQNTQLIVRHTATTFALGSGVSAGTSSATGDNIIGPSGSHTLTIVDTSGTGAYGTVSLNGAPPVAFDSSQTDLAVTGPNGEIVHLNTTAITAGFNGTVDLGGEGTLSMDGGSTEVPIDFSTAQALTTADGRTTFIDSTGISRAGVDQVEYAGVSNVFQALADLRDEILNLRDLPASEWQDALTRRVDEVTRHQSHILEVVGSQAQTLKTINDIGNRLGELTLDAKERLSEVAKTDIPAAAVALQEANNLLEYSYAVTAKVFNTSLLDYMA